MEKRRRRELMHSVFIGCFIAALVVGGGSYVWKHREEHKDKIDKIHRFLSLLSRMRKRASADLAEYIEHLKGMSHREEAGGHESFLSLFRRQPRFASTDPWKDYIDLKISGTDARRFLAEMGKKYPELKELAERLAAVFLDERERGQTRREG